MIVPAPFVRERSCKIPERVVVVVDLLGEEVAKATGVVTPGRAVEMIPVDQ